MCSSCQQTASPSLKRSATGRAPGPRGCHVSQRHRGPGILPLSPDWLKLRGLPLLSSKRVPFEPRSGSIQFQTSLLYDITAPMRIALRHRAGALTDKLQPSSMQCCSLLSLAADSDE
jgi:hypothetical protein